MFFDKNNYSNESAYLLGNKISYRAYRNIVFVDNPIGDFHKMNIYVPSEYYNGKSINDYTLKTAPIFMPNSVGGYLPGMIEKPKKSVTISLALRHGYIVVSPAIRGRTLKNANALNYGKAPACIIDYKAAVRFLHKFANDLPGDDNKIITNGTSAGGALSCLMGVTGNHPDYEEYLHSIGSADANDTVFAASCYCPITNLDNADMAYEWQFNGVYRYYNTNKSIFPFMGKKMSAERIKVSKDESALFPDYINSLNLKDENACALTLNKDGNGTFKEYIKSIIIHSAQTAVNNGENLSDKKWLDIQNDKVVDMDLHAFAKDITRMKNAPAFDDITMTSAENNLFGNEINDFAHFTKYSVQHSILHGVTAQDKIIKMLNPMYYINDEKAKKSKYFRIRHGELDRDTSIAISAILNLKLNEIGCIVDYKCPWNVAHSGDYDLDELFLWIDNICTQT